MSELVAFTGGRFGANRSRLLEMARLARCVHRFAPVMVIVVGAMLLAGCPPPPLSLDEPDARPNSPPGITSVRSETGVEFKVGDDNTITIDTSTMTLGLVDSDVDDTLYVRGFFDYGELNPPLPQYPAARAQCTVGPSTPRSSERTVTCILFAYCQMTDIPSNPHRLDVVVSDRLPDDSGEQFPPYYGFADPESVGLQATRTYRIVCQEQT